LGMKRTTFGIPRDENYARSHLTLINGTSFEIPPPVLNDGQLIGTAGCCKSSVHDLLIYYDALLRTASSQAKAHSSVTSGSPFHRVSDMWKGYIPITDNVQYGLGWVVAELPSKGGLVGMNAYNGYCGYQGMPEIGKGIASRQRIIYHNGAMNGALSVVYLLPDSDAAIVVLSNSLDLCDTPDWVGQLLVETFLECPKPNDFVALAKKTTAKALTHHPAIHNQLARERVHNTPVKPLRKYTGRYQNKNRNFRLDISINGDGLRMTVQGFPHVYYDLYHYNFNVFAWDCDRDAETKAIIFPQADIGYHKVVFGSDWKGEIKNLTWAYDGAVPKGEIFVKE